MKESAKSSVEIRRQRGRAAPRCLVEPASWEAPLLVPAPGEAARLSRVLRMRDGDPVTAFDGCGRSAAARLASDPDDGAPRLKKIAAAADKVAAPPLPILLFTAIPKAGRMDWLVEKATEMGVEAVIPLLTARSVVRPDAAAGGRRLQRWRRIAQQAARQCGLDSVPAIEACVEIEAALARLAGQSAGGIYGSLEDDALPPEAALEAAGPSARTAVFIGPEGDFTDGERARLRAAGMAPMTLGPRVLRVETAALAAVCLLGHALSRRTEGGTVCVRSS